MKRFLGRSGVVWALVLCSLIGLIVSALSLAAHYDTNTTFCTISEKLNCDVVNRGPYSEIVGVPVALLGVIGYVAFGLLAFFHKRVAKILVFNRKEYWFYIAMLSTAMLAFALYLTALEIFVIHAFCILCLISQGAVIILALFSWWAWHTGRA